MTTDEAVRELYQAPLERFVAERKRLAGELRAAGDKAAASELLAKKRPSISAWAVNQLYWHARDAFDELLDSAQRLRGGHLDAQTAHRDALAKLRKRASAFLRDAGHAASEGTLRRVTTTLAAIAATGGWEPDLPGALVEDREPPGFGVPGLVVGEHHTKVHDGHAKDESSKLRARAHAIAEEAKRKRHRLEAALRTAKGEIQTRERELHAAEKAVDHARKALQASHDAVADLERELDKVDDHN